MTGAIKLRHFLCCVKIKSNANSMLGNHAVAARSAKPEVMVILKELAIILR
jgi:hypothetical protein